MNEEVVNALMNHMLSGIPDDDRKTIESCAILHDRIDEVVSKVVKDTGLDGFDLYMSIYLYAVLTLLAASDDKDDARLMMYKLIDMTEETSDKVMDSIIERMPKC